MEISSFSGSRYFVAFIDDKTRKTFVYILREKSELYCKLVEFKNLVETQTGKRLKTLRSDNGKEYVKKKVDEFLKENGIVHQLTVDYTPQQNGVCERANRTIVERARSMLEEAHLPKIYWAEAVSTAVYLKNRSPTIAVKDMTPEEAWTNRKVDLSHLRTFGSRAFMHIPDQKRRKFDPKSVELVFVGYCESTKGYRLIHPKTLKLYKARDVVFFENQKANIEVQTDKIQAKFEEAVPPVGNIPTVESDSVREMQTADVLDRPENFVPNSDTIIEIECAREERTVPTPPPTCTEGEVETSERKYPLRERQPKDYKDYILYHAKNEVLNEPVTVEEALSSEDKEEWQRAIESELNSLKKNNTWSLVNTANGHFVDSKWIFRIKKEAGKIRYKARLVARGFTQVRGVNYNEVFSPVVRHSTLRLLLALAVEHNLKIDHMDVVTAFLNGDLNEKIYMKQPKGFEEKGKENYVCLLNKALYGLKQAPRAWNEKLNEALLNLNFKRSENEPCVYIRKTINSLMIIAVYVDDLLIFWNHEKELKLIKQELQNNFEMKDLGKADVFLGLKIKQDNGVVKINQTEYLKKILEKFGMTDCKTVKTPLDTKLKLIKPERADYVPPSELPYRELIGSLMYLVVCTRPDIAYATSYLSQFNNCYDHTHWVAAKRVLRYLNGTKNFQLVYKKTGKPLFGYVDADHAGDICDRRSYSGFAFIFAGGPVSWECKKQKTVALSSAEAEYMALAEACRESVFLKRLFTELTEQDICSMVLLSDSQSAIRIAENPVHHQRTKHIDVKHHFIREKVNCRAVVLRYVATQEMMADMLTKGLPREKLECCVRGLGCEYAS